MPKRKKQARASWGGFGIVPTRPLPFLPPRGPCPSCPHETLALLGPTRPLSFLGPTRPLSLLPLRASVARKAPSRRPVPSTGRIPARLAFGPWRAAKTHSRAIAPHGRRAEDAWRGSASPPPPRCPAFYFPRDLNIFVMQRFFCSMFGCT